MSTRKRVLVACGSSVATSMVVARKLAEELGKRGRTVAITQCKACEVETLAEGHDLIVTTSALGVVLDIPVVHAVSFLTGVGLESDIDKIIDYLS